MVSLTAGSSSSAGRIGAEAIESLLSQRVTGYEPLSGFAANTVAAVTLGSGARAVFKAAAIDHTSLNRVWFPGMPERSALALIVMVASTASGRTRATCRTGR
ncbi:hypothetical protein [Nonomuraea jabiensis]|uniref:Uncharacterized protein n=1 Tax=Nonomuraea jabiensis TaxID=882448 RepID=A0A7W9GJ47_9ACTN|nr:hypothetical protein [Nonomuraea jabiensis]MBB5784749.1 hypothetical protein [Nonomuraea jabiensis]